MARPARILYLHGFASGPTSRKAAFFSQRLRQLGFEVHIPDLAEGDFEALTITGQLAVVEKLGRGMPVTVIGSSLGGYLAALYAARHPEVAQLVLLAPAFGFYDLWSAELGPQRMEEWRTAGTLPVYHYGAGREMALRYGFIEDASHFVGYPHFEQPALIFHGEQDGVVPISVSERFVQMHEKARLVRFSSGHELTDVLERMWTETENFLFPPG